MKNYRNTSKFAAIAFIISLIFALSVAILFVLPDRIALADSNNEIDILSQTIGADTSQNYILSASLDAAFGKVLKFQQLHDGKVVDGAQVSVCLDKNGNIVAHTGSFVDISPVNKMKLSPSYAKSLISSAVGQPIISINDIYYFDGKDVYFAYSLTAADMTSNYIASAEDGTILSKRSGSYVKKTNTDAFGKQVEIDVSYDGQKYLLKDDVRHIYVANVDGGTYHDAPDYDFSDQIYTSQSGEDFYDIAVTSMLYAAKAYDFYLDSNNIGVARYGINDKNNNDDPNDDYEVRVLLNYGSDRPDSDENNNASFASSNNINFGLMCIGNGKREQGELYQQAKALDIIAHEYQHGVTRFIADFNGVEESGALDEAFSDIFGALIEGCDPSDLTSGFWTIGEDGVYDPLSMGLYARSLISGTPDYAYDMANKYKCRHGLNESHSPEVCDNGGVHLNSTIISHVQYELCYLAPSFFTRQRIGTLWYSTLLQLNRNSNFLDFTNAFIRTAEMLDYPDNIKENINMALSKAGLIDDSYHTVTFLDRNFQKQSSTLVKDGGSIVPPTIEQTIEQEYSTLRFDAWYDNATKAPADMNILNFVDRDIILYPNYKTYCTVIFLDINSSILSQKEYEQGQTISPFDYASSLDAAKYEFMGWRAEDTPDGFVVDFSTDYRVYKHTTFSPVTSIRSYVINFVTDGNIFLVEQHKYGDIVSLSIDKKREGYTLEGFYLDEALTTPVKKISVTGDTTVYVKWIENSDYSNKTSLIIICASIAVALIIFVPLIILVTRRRKRK